MKPVDIYKRDQLKEASFAALRGICEKIRKEYAGERDNGWMCMNCGLEQRPDSCSICKTSDYLVPDTEEVRQLLQSQQSIDRIREATREENIE